MIATNPTAAALAALATEYRLEVDDLQARYSSRARALLPETVPSEMSLLLLESIAAATSGEFKVAQALPAPPEGSPQKEEVLNVSDTTPLADKIAAVLGRDKARAATILKRMKAQGMYIGNTDNPAQAIRTVLAVNARFKRVSRGLYCLKEHTPTEKRRHTGGRVSAYYPMALKYLSGFEEGTIFNTGDIEEAGVPRSSHYHILKKLADAGVIDRTPAGTWKLSQRPTDQDPA